MKHNIFNKPVIREFVSYCESFYGPAGIYPLGCNRADIESAILTYVQTLASYGQGAWGYGDSIDRERVADILCKRGFAYPEFEGVR